MVGAEVMNYHNLNADCCRIYSETINTPEAFPDGCNGHKGITNWHPDYMAARKRYHDALIKDWFLPEDHVDSQPFDLPPWDEMTRPFVPEVVS
jgi:hypothetical protein